MTTKRNGKGGGSGDRELDDLAALLESAGDGDAAAGDAAPGKPADQGELAARLKTCAIALERAHAFRKGQLVRWKKGLKNKRTPDYGQPAVVVDVLNTPIYDAAGTKGAGSPYFMEPLTLVAGLIDSDGDFICFHFDSHRFEPFAEEA